MCYLAFTQVLAMLPVAVTLKVLLGSGSLLLTWAASIRRKLLSHWLRWNYSLFLKDEYMSDSLSECGLRSSDPKPPFPVTSDPGATLFYHLKP